MKRIKFLSVITAILMLVSVMFSACGNTTQPTDAATEAATESRYAEPSDINNPELTLIAIPIFLKDGEYLYANKNNFKCFAFVGTNEDDAQLLFMLTDETAAMMREQNRDSRYYISIGEEETHIGDITFNDDCTIATLKEKGQQPYEIMVKLATRIRGLD